MATNLFDAETVGSGSNNPLQLNPSGVALQVSISIPGAYAARDQSILRKRLRGENNDPVHPSGR